MEIKEYTLVTERLTLELLDEKHTDEIWPYVSDPRISIQMSWDAHQNIAETKQFIANVKTSFEQGRAVSWAIRFENKVVGLFSVITILRKHRSLTYNKAELAYWIGPEYQGKGIMTESGVEILKFAFTKMGLNKIYVGFHEGNKGSKGLIERLKFPFSHIEKEAFRKDGEWIDVFYYQMLEKEYKALYK